MCDQCCANNNKKNACSDKAKLDLLQNTFFKIVSSENDDKIKIGENFGKILLTSSALCEHTIFLIGYQYGMGEGKKFQYLIDHMPTTDSLAVTGDKQRES
jgi:hypothetical protein